MLDFIQAEQLFTAKSRILVACSGGVDSMVLLHFLALHRQRLDIEVGAVHVDHMLRGEESAADAVLVEDFCTELAVPFYSGSVPVPLILEQKGGNVQAVCREGRYAFFEQIMKDYHYERLATAHHAEDQLETVLMQVTKGNHALGMPTKRAIGEGLLIRPFLPVVKEALYAYATKFEIHFHEDPSNSSRAYMRNRFRQEVVPHIIRENPVAAEKVVGLTKELQADEALLQTYAKEWIDRNLTFSSEGFPCIDIRTFNAMPTALQRRAIPLLLGYLYHKKNRPIAYGSELIENLMVHLRSKEGNVAIDLPLGFRFIREYDKFTFVSRDEIQEKDVSQVVPIGRQVTWMNNTWLYWGHAEDVQPSIWSAATEIMYFDLPDGSLPFSVRTRKEGDRMMLPGMTSAKRLSRLFIDEKVGKVLRDDLPVLLTKKGSVCAVPGLRYGEVFTKNKTATSKYIFLVGKI